MRSVITVLLAAAVGLHCSAPVDAPPETTAASEVVAPAPPAKGSEAQRPAETSTSSVPDSSTPAPMVPGLAAMIGNGEVPHVTSTITDETGSLYATGTFVGSVSIDSAQITSRGDKDVFLLKLDSRGMFQWVKTVGSASLESAPRVTLEDGGRVTVVGMTKGDLDCGSGPLQRWASETFFLCIFGGADGSAISGGVFPTGSP